MAIEGCPGFDADAAYAAMDFLLDALDEIAAGVFDTTGACQEMSALAQKRWSARRVPAR